MAEEPGVIDISGAPELLRLAEEVRHSHRPYLLKCGDVALARLVPLAHPVKQRGRVKGDRDAFLASAGGWKDLVDTDRLVADIYESRRNSSRPPVDL